MLKLINVKKNFGNKIACDDINIELGKGLHFIVGPSGSGKSTLLNIISGQIRNYHGEVLLNDSSLNGLLDDSIQVFHNKIVAHIKQEDELVEDFSILENLKIPFNIRDGINYKEMERVLKELKIFEHIDKPVKHLSGGQRKRVALAREILKNNPIILADEPTSSLDKDSALIIMKTLRRLAKTRIVVIVTHDESLIQNKDHVIYLNYGLIEEERNKESLQSLVNFNSGALNIKPVYYLDILKTKFVRKPIQIMSQIGIICLSSMILFTALSGSLLQSTAGEIDKLIETYGDSLLDISLHKSIMNAAGTDNKDPDNPSGEVNQDIIHFFDQFKNDERVEFITYLKPFDDIKVGYNGASYNVEGTGNTPIIGTLIAGEMPSDKNPGIAVPHTLAQKLGLKNEDIIGQEIDFSAVVGNWDSGTYEYANAKTTARVVAVLDTTIFFDQGENSFEFEVTDSFIFSPEILKDLLDQANTNIGSSSVNMRPKTPEDMISIKDELMKQGIVPLGQFELVEDYVRLGNQTQSQTQGANIILILIALLIIVSGGFMVINTQKKDIQVYLAQGYSKKQLTSMFIIELGVVSLLSALLMLVFLNPLSMILKSLLATQLNRSIVLFELIAALILAIVIALSIVIIKERNNIGNQQND